MTDEELLSYISESSMMSKAMDEYEGARSCTRMPVSSYTLACTLDPRP